jgi:hypothetical protein
MIENIGTTTTLDIVGHVIPSECHASVIVQPHARLLPQFSFVPTSSAAHSTA